MMSSCICLFKQKTAYEMRISDSSSDVCSSDLTEESSHGITKDFADKWCKKRSYETDFYRYTRISILASFSSYLRDLGIDSYIPKLPCYQPHTFIPYRSDARRVGKECVVRVDLGVRRFIKI